jgi:hypothetical protein
MECRMKTSPERNLLSLFPATFAVVLSLTCDALLAGTQHRAQCLANAGAMARQVMVQQR